MRPLLCVACFAALRLTGGTDFQAHGADDAPPSAKEFDQAGTELDKAIKEAKEGVPKAAERLKAAAEKVSKEWECRLKECKAQGRVKEAEHKLNEANWGLDKARLECERDALKHERDALLKKVEELNNKLDEKKKGGKTGTSRLPAGVYTRSEGGYAYQIETDGVETDGHLTFTFTLLNLRTGSTLTLWADYRPAAGAGRLAGSFVTFAFDHKPGLGQDVKPEAWLDKGWEFTLLVQSDGVTLKHHGGETAREVGPLLGGRYQLESL